LGEVLSSKTHLLEVYDFIVDIYILLRGIVEWPCEPSNYTCCKQGNIGNTKEMMPKFFVIL